ncbi:MAG: DUF4258 domain-containing protein [Deltaproteobacteria bacterium]|nr:DUF4258 domain-containing protein [Deltaproteobacteria bacterium]MCL5276190.1 DUF4258 domain-containing protein [Deltaproteobacteria bacterium]
MRIVFTEHARFEAERRGIKEDTIRDLINQPQQEIPIQKGRVIFQNKYFDTSIKKEMLLRVIGKKVHNRFIVITAYKTSRIEKYWGKGEK